MEILIGLVRRGQKARVIPDIIPMSMADEKFEIVNVKDHPVG
jgi:hypothetical protein